MTSTTRPAPPRRPVGRRLSVVLLGAAVTGACSLPMVDAPGNEPPAREAPLAAEQPDPSVQRVRSAATDLTATVEAARAALADAADADSPAAARQAAQVALAALIDGAGDGPTPPSGALFARQTPDRGSTADADDRFTLALTAARDSGRPGSQLLDLLRDPIAGDLGAWQRDAAGVLSSVDSTIALSRDLAQLEVEIAELPGLGTRAIAWARLTATADDLDTASAFAERGEANLEVIVVTLERFLEELEDDAAPVDGADEAEGADADEAAASGASA